MNLLRRLIFGVDLLIYFSWQLILSNWNVAKACFGPTANLTPAFVRVPLGVRKNVSIATLANMITLTPGTLSVEVVAGTDNRPELIVYALLCGETAAAFAEIKTGFEARIHRVFE